jgi:predicted MFS family arabinose efflux permease
VPVGIALLYFVPRIVPESKANLKHMHLDLPGAVLATSGLMLLVYGLVKAPEFGWTSSHSIQYIGGSIVLLGLFILNEARSKQPLMPLHIFKNRNLQGGNLVQLPITAAMFSMFFFLSLYIQTTLDFSPIKTGFAFFPVTIVIGITSAIISNVVTKIGFKPPMIVGPLFLAAGLMWFTKLPVDGSYLTDVLPGLMIMALGLGFSFVSVTIAATSGVSHDESGLASGILNTSQQIGGSLGLAILSGVYAATLKDNLVTTGGDVVASQVAGYHDAFKIGVGFALTASIFAMIFIKNKVVKSSEVHPAG